MNNQDKFTTQSSKRQSKFAIDITLSCQIFYRYSLSSLVAFAFCLLLFFFFLIKNTYSDTHSTMPGWVNDKKISPAQFPETRLLLFFFKKKSFYSFQIQPLGSMLMNGQLSCCSPCSMMLQGVQFRFLIFIHQRVFAARFLTFQFSSPKKYNIVSSLSLSLGGSSIHYGARIREKL